MFGFFKKKKLARFTPSLPLTWWIDDLSHSVCGLVDDPIRGLKDMPWPDSDKVYLAVNKEAYDALVIRNVELVKRLDYFTRRFHEVQGSLAALIEVSECRSDEDCDHCVAVSVLSK